MESNLITDPFATNENAFAAVRVGKVVKEWQQSARSQADDPLATNPLPEVALSSAAREQCRDQTHVVGQSSGTALACSTGFSRKRPVRKPSG